MLFYLAVEDVTATVAEAGMLDAIVVRPVQHVPGTSFRVFANTRVTGSRRERPKWARADWGTKVSGRAHA